MEERASDSVKNLYSSYATNLLCDLWGHLITMLQFFFFFRNATLLNSQHGYLNINRVLRWVQFLRLVFFGWGMLT